MTEGVSADLEAREAQMWDVMREWAPREDGLYDKFFDDLTTYRRAIEARVKAEYGGRVFTCQCGQVTRLAIFEETHALRLLTTSSVEHGPNVPRAGSSHPDGGDRV